MRTSLLIPAYNEAIRFQKSLPRLRADLWARLDLEVIVVDDGSTDNTFHTAVEHLAGWHSTKVLRLPWNQGKGGALKAGVAAASGDVVVLMDADLSADLADLPEMVERLDRVDVVLGTRMAAGSRVIYTRNGRRISSRLFNAVACSLTGVVASDTQCGFKAFRTPVAKMLFHLARTSGFAIDVEILILAQMLGFTIAEVPIGWTEVEGSRVRPIKDPVRMLRDVYAARREAVRLARKMTSLSSEVPLYKHLDEVQVWRREDAHPRVLDLREAMAAGDVERL